MINTPRVTLGIATYNRDTYLTEAIESCLNQEYGSLEVLVVIDGSTNPRIDEVVASFSDDSRLRVVRHETNQGIAAAYNTFVSEGRGELIAMLGDDDISLPGRIRRQVEIFDRFPETGVVHGDGTVIDADGKRIGVWPSQELSPSQLVHSFFFSHNHIVDPTRMVHRRVYEAVGGYDDRYPIANDFDFWIRAAKRFRFRHVSGGPLAAIRRHGENASDEQAGRAAEIADVEAILASALELYEPSELVPALDWSVLDPAEGERQALLRLAAGLDQRLLPLPRLASSLRDRAARLPAPARPISRSAAGKPAKLMMTSFGFNDSGGGTTVPRLAAKELARRGWDVTVFHAAVQPTPTRTPCEVTEWEEDGVRLIGVHNRAHGLWDLGNPLRELDDPPITAAFAAALDSVVPDVVHFHNLHNLGAALIDQAAVRGLPAFFTTHNYWLICPRAYLLTGQGAICNGPGDGGRCAACTGSQDMHSHKRRLAEIRARAHSGLTRILAVSDAVRHALLGSGYDPTLIEVVRQAMPHEGEIWSRTGHQRQPGRLRDRLTVAFLGSAYPHKGPQLLVDAAQRTSAELDVRIIGEISPEFAARLHALDRRGVVQLHGSFALSELADLLGDVDVAVLPSMWWDCAPLAAAECLAARVPLVVPRLGGLPEAIREEIDGLLFNGLDAEDLAKQLDRLALEPDLLGRLQANIAEPRAFSEYIDTLEAYYDGDALMQDSVGSPLHPDAPAIRWKGDHGLPHSLSIINDRVSERLPGPVQRVEADGSPRDSPLPHPAQVEVHQQWPPDLSEPGSGALAAIVPWEFGSVPRAWADEITANVDELWVPSDYVRSMYTNDGVDPDRVVTIPNGVDLDLFSPAAIPSRSSAARPEVRFLFVGGLILRKGPDVLLAAFKRAFADRDDVTLVIKDYGADGVYAGGNRDPFREHMASGDLPKIELQDQDLSATELAALYRSCDVLVHPYRGEGFAMPVLEAMASGLPVIVTSGGPTDEFCPPEAGWRIRSSRFAMPADQLGAFTPVTTPWMLEPDADHLVDLLREAASDQEARRARGIAARAAAETLSWDAVAARYSERIAVLARSRPKRAGGTSEPFPLADAVDCKVLATPAWRGQDRLAELLREWGQATAAQTSACLYLLADPTVAGSPEVVEALILAAAGRANLNLDSCADIDVLLEPFHAQRDQRLHHAIDAYVPLHPGCAGHIRLARESNNTIVTVGDGALAALIAATAGPPS
jgi:glycosyltransferase involved in cell wall biosynthesis